jgi:hypothetical protein
VRAAVRVPYIATRGVITMASQLSSQLSSQASQDTEDGLAAALNGVALSASQNEDFDEEEDDYESSQTEEIQETIASEQKNEFVM